MIRRESIIMIYIPFLHLSSPRSLVTYISYYILSLIRVYIIRILQLFSREYDIYTKYIIYIHFNISHHTLQTYHVRSIIYDMICFVFFFFECIDICNIYIYILHVHICLMKMRSMHISLGVDHCIDYLQ